MIPTLLRPFPAVLAAFVLAACAAGPHPGASSTNENSHLSDLVVPIPIEQSFLDGKGLVADDPAEYDDDTASANGGEREAVIRSSSHMFHHDNIRVSVVETGPNKVRVDGLPFDEFVHILMGRLILTLDDGRKFEFEQGDSFIVPKGFVGIWEMPERYRELVVLDTEALPAP